MQANQSKATQFVSVGDILKFEFKHYPMSRPTERFVRGRVLGVTRRYMPGDGDLIAYRNLDTGEVSYADQHYVTEIESHQVSPVRPPKNIYRQRNFLLVERISVGKLSGNLVDLTSHCLAALTIELPRPIDLTRLEELFAKQKPGLVGYRWGQSWWLVVREKPFRAWVRHNAYRFMATVAEMRAYAIEDYELRRDDELREMQELSQSDDYH